jgi:hypothetical protein
MIAGDMCDDCKATSEPDREAIVADVSRMIYEWDVSDAMETE